MTPNRNLNADPRPGQRGPGGGALRCHQDGGSRDHWSIGCPDGCPQRPGRLLGYRLKGEDYLQIRVALSDRDSSVCRIFIEEGPDRIYVSARVHVDDDTESRVGRPESDVGCCVELDAPLGHRVVIDSDSGEELPWLHLRSGSFTPWRYVPRPPGNLWPSDGLESLDTDDDAEANPEEGVTPRPAEHRLVDLLNGITEF